MNFNEIWMKIVYLKSVAKINKFIRIKKLIYIAYCQE